jgi:DNA-binding transcriptional MocR family regulator
MMLPDVQYVHRPGIVELRWGDPAPELLPAAELARAASHALAHHGPDALNYGADQGPGRLLAALAGWLARTEGHAPPVERIFITGGVSQALDHICTLWASPGDPVLVEAPTYHLALRVFRDHRLHVVPVATDADGVRPEALEAALGGLRAEGRPARFLYTVPTFGNPTGATLPVERRRAVAEIAGRAGLMVLEDDVYRYLGYDAPAPPPLSDLDATGNVIRLGSFSKILAPGLRVGWLLAAPEVVMRLAGSGLVDSGGGLSHFSAHVAAAFIELGLLDAHVEMLRAAYRGRRDVLIGAMQQHLLPGCEWRVPGGGFFVWLRLPEGYNSSALLGAAEAAGVSYAPGARFFSSGGERYLRLSFSLLPPEALEEGVRRLGGVLRAAQPETRGEDR